MRTSCSVPDWMSLSPIDQITLAREFLSLIRKKYPNSEFGYDSFPDLDYERMVMSSIFTMLKDWNYLKVTGYMTFRLTPLGSSGVQ